MNVILRLTGKQHQQLQHHLYPGDNNEAVAILLCGRRKGLQRHCLSVIEVVPIPYTECSVRKPDLIIWSTTSLKPLLDRATNDNLALVKVHSHPGGYAAFSQVDDKSDQELFPSIYSWLDDNQPHASVIMLPTGEMFGRVVSDEGEFSPLELISVAGDDIYLWLTKQENETHAVQQRLKQAFGSGTTNLLGQISVAVVGCSGTGGPMIEQLSRLGVKKLVLVDPDNVEHKNLNRIPNTTWQDAIDETPKVKALKRAIDNIGLGTEVIALQCNLQDLRAIESVAECDIVIGCMDSVFGRHVLNRIAVTYCIPYFDVGVKIVADGIGGIEHLIGTVHYLQPDGSSLRSRGVYTSEGLRSDGLKINNPEQYETLKKEKYIQGVNEERPAVISLNTLFASLTMLELLARLHPYRFAANTQFATYRINLVEGEIMREPENQPDEAQLKHLGRGDQALPLGLTLNL
jgi:hypothetical protein